MNCIVVYDFWENYFLKVFYYVYGNISVEYWDGIFRGRYEFMIFNFMFKIFYIVRYFVLDGFVDINNIIIEGVLLNFFKFDRYRYEINNGLGIEFYVVNVLMNFIKL